MTKSLIRACGGWQVTVTAASVNVMVEIAAPDTLTDAAKSTWVSDLTVTLATKIDTPANANTFLTNANVADVVVETAPVMIVVYPEPHTCTPRAPARRELAWGGAQRTHRIMSGEWRVVSDQSDRPCPAKIAAAYFVRWAAPP